MVRQVVYVALEAVESTDERTKAIEAACNWDWLAEYRLVGVDLYSAGGGFGYYLFFEKD